MGKKEDFHEGVQELFQPTFGNRPTQYIGRDGEIEQFMAGLKEPVGSRKRLIEAGVIESPPSWRVGVCSTLSVGVFAEHGLNEIGIERLS